MYEAYPIRMRDTADLKASVCNRTSHGFDNNFLIHQSYFILIMLINLILNWS